MKIKGSILLEILLTVTNELIVVVDKDGRLVELSQAYAEFLEMPREAAVGRPVTEVIENTRLHIVAQTGVAEEEQIQKIRGNDAIVTRLPIYENGRLSGAFAHVLFRDVNELNLLYKKINRIENELTQYKRQFGKINTAKHTIDSIIGKSPLMTDLKDSVSKISKTNSSILILGESGTGKEIFAHAIHNASDRTQCPFVSVNCGSIPSELLESEMFGYEEGSFTGAKKGGSAGLFQTAHRGTIFLDEIGELPMPMQVKMLRVLQEREVRPIGANTSIPIDIRVIAATNRDISELIAEKRFREDLYYRLNVISLRLPSLRERKEDIPLLADGILRKLAAGNHVQNAKISTSAMAILKNYDWPGNVRELENTLEHALNYVGKDRMIQISHLPGNLVPQRAPSEGKRLDEILHDVERLAIIEALRRNKDKKSATARDLGIGRTSLYEKMKKYGIEITT
jgi:transcriptional regulator with PAS, ATPase and Fis domain